MRALGIVSVCVSLAAAAGCDGAFGGGGNADAQAQVDPSQLTSSGEVALADGGSMTFSITSERYKQWDQARRAFPKSLITRFGQVLQPRSPTERSINNAVALLEANPRARQAIEGAGLSVRGFVETTVALEQQMLMASTGGARPETPPMPDTYPMTMDSGYYPMPATPAQPYTPMPVAPMPAPYTPYPVTPAPVTPTPALPYPRDTVRRDTIVPAPAPSPLPIPVPRPDTMRRDTAPVRRDTIVAPRPQPRDTLRDTSATAPPDSVRRA